MEAASVVSSHRYVTRRRTTVPTAHEIAQARRVRELALPWYRARRLAAATHVERWAAERALRPLAPTELAILGVVRATREVGAPGVQVAIDELAERVGRSPRMVRYALDGLGDHRVRCEGACAKPGFYTRRARDGAEQRLPRCPGCADPCPPDCTDHLNLVRRVRQFVEVAWQDPATGRRYRKRQCPSVLVHATTARQIEADEQRRKAFWRRRDRRLAGAASVASHSKSPDLSLSTRRVNDPSLWDATARRGGAASLRDHLPKVSAPPTGDGSAASGRSGAQDEEGRAEREAHPPAAPEGVGDRQAAAAARMRAGDPESLSWLEVAERAWAARGPRGEGER